MDGGEADTHPAGWRGGVSHWLSFDFSTEDTHFAKLTFLILGFSQHQLQLFISFSQS